MTLVNIARFGKFKESKIKGQLFEGTVASIDDPDKLGRLRVRVSELHGTSTAIPDDDLPWMAMMMGPASGFWFFLPKKDETVSVVFMDDNPYTGVWLPKILSSQDSISDFTGDYGDIYGWVDGLGNKVLFNNADGTEDFTFLQHTGNKLHMDKDGKVTVTVKGDFSLDVQNGGKIDITGDSSITIHGKSDVTVKSDTLVRLNPSS